jgi:hypothetical protein
MYSIRFDHDRNLLDIEWHGLFTRESAAAYAQDLYGRFAREGFAPGYRLRIDMRHSGAQPQSTLIGFEQGFTGFPRASRIAIVAASTVLRMQVKRVMTQPYMRVFAEADPALAWLLEEQEAPLPA